MSVWILAPDIRRKIVTLLRDGELNAGEISKRLDRSRPCVSHHLGLLVDAGLLTRRNEGPFRFYTLHLERAFAAWDDLVRSEQCSAAMEKEEVRVGSD